MKLDSEQEEAVNHSSSTICIAGPGSGKTRTLVAKAERLWAEGRDLICLTFTRSAAREMRDRMPGIPAQTIHSFCYEEVGWKGTYDNLLLDFDLKKHKPKFDHVLVDEVQDLTEVQLGIVGSIVGKYLFAVGDPYQSIYGFNDALGLEAIERLSEFCEIHFLKNNYRSCPRVVDLLNNIYGRGLVSTDTKETGLTAILARTNKLVKEAAETLDEGKVGYTVKYGNNELVGYREKFCGDEGLRLMTCHCSKGLEFDWVILYKWNHEEMGKTEERNLYYVSVARASKGFTEVYSEYGLLKALEGRLR